MGSPYLWSVSDKRVCVSFFFLFSLNMMQLTKMQSSKLLTQFFNYYSTLLFLLKMTCIFFAKIWIFYFFVNCAPKIDLTFPFFLCVCVCVIDHPISFHTFPSFFPPISFLFSLVLPRVCLN